MSVLPCSFLFLLLLCLPVLTDGKRLKPDKPRQPPPTTQPAKRSRNRSVPGSGELTTKEGHRCTWQTSGEVLVSLTVNCSTETLGGQQRSEKTYRVLSVFRCSSWSTCAVFIHPSTAFHFLVHDVSVIYKKNLDFME